MLPPDAYECDTAPEIEAFLASLGYTDLIQCISLNRFIRQRRHDAAERRCFLDYLVEASDGCRVVRVVIEAKRPPIALKAAIPQAEGYAQVLGASYFLVTNGDLHALHRVGESSPMWGPVPWTPDLTNVLAGYLFPQALLEEFPTSDSTLESDRLGPELPAVVVFDECTFTYDNNEFLKSDIVAGGIRLDRSSENLIAKFDTRARNDAVQRIREELRLTTTYLRCDDVEQRLLYGRESKWSAHFPRRQLTSDQHAALLPYYGLLPPDDESPSSHAARDGKTIEVAHEVWLNLDASQPMKLGGRFTESVWIAGVLLPLMTGTFTGRFKLSLESAVG